MAGIGRPVKDDDFISTDPGSGMENYAEIHKVDEFSETSISPLRSETPMSPLIQEQLVGVTDTTNNMLATSQDQRKLLCCIDNFKVSVHDKFEFAPPAIAQHVRAKKEWHGEGQRFESASETTVPKWTIRERAPESESQNPDERSTPDKPQGNQSSTTRTVTHGSDKLEGKTAQAVAHVPKNRMSSSQTRENIFEDACRRHVQCYGVRHESCGSPQTEERCQRGQDTISSSQSGQFPRTDVIDLNTPDRQAQNGSNGQSSSPKSYIAPKSGFKVSNVRLDYSPLVSRITPRERQKHATWMNEASNTTSNVPSTEDLLLLAMRQNRLTKSVDSRVTKEFSVLKEIVKKHKIRAEHLLEDRDSLAQQLKEAKDLHDKRENDLKAFATKFRKFKDWALQVNREYTLLRQQHQELQVSLSSAGTTGRKITTELDELKQRQQMLQANNEMLLAEIFGLKSSFENLQITANLYETKLKSKECALQQANIDKRKLELYIRELHVSQQSFNNQTVTQYSLLTEALQVLKIDVQRSFDKSTFTNSFQGYSETLQEIFNKVTTLLAEVCGTSSKLMHFDKALNAIELVIETHSSSSNASHNQSLVYLEHVQESINSLQRNLDGQIDLRKTNVQLLERVQAVFVHQDMLINDKTVTEQQAKELQQSLDKVVAEILETRSNNVTTNNELVSKLEDQIQGLQNNLTVALDLTQTTDRKLQTAEGRISELHEEMQIGQKSHAAEKTELESALRRQVDELKNELSLCNTAYELELTHRSELYQEAMTKTKSELERLQVLSNQDRKSLKDSELFTADLTRKLQEANGKIDDLNGQLQRKTKEHDLNLTNYTEAKCVASAVNILEEQLQSIETKTKELELELLSFENCKSKLSSCENERSALAQELVLQENKLFEMQKEADKVDDLARQVGNLERELRTANIELKASRNNTKLVDDLRAKIEEQSKAMLDTKNQVELLQNQLANSTQREVEKEFVLQEKRQEMDVKAVMLHQQVQKLESTSEELRTVREQNARQSGELVSWKKHCEVLRSCLEAFARKSTQVSTQSSSQNSAIPFQSIHPSPRTEVQIANSQFIDPVLASAGQQVCVGISNDAKCPLDDKCTASCDIEPQLTVMSSIPAERTICDLPELPSSQDDFVAETQQNDSIQPEIPDGIENTHCASQPAEIDLDAIVSDVKSISPSVRKDDEAFYSYRSPKPEMEVWDIPQSPLYQHHSQTVRKPHKLRTRSNVSQESMLLHNTPRHNAMQHGSTKSVASMTQSQIAPVIEQSTLAPASSSHGWDSRIASHRCQDDGNTPDSPTNEMRERHMPNSAAKRKANADGEVESQIPSKRLKRYPQNLAVIAPISSQIASAKGQNSSIFSTPALAKLPVGSRIGHHPYHEAHAQQEEPRKVGRKRKSSRNSRYAKRFANNENVKQS